MMLGVSTGDAAVGATGSATVGVGVGFAATTVVMLSLYDNMHHDLLVFIAPESGPDLDDMWDRAFSIDHDGKLLLNLLSLSRYNSSFFFSLRLVTTGQKSQLDFCMGKVSWTFPLIVYCIQISFWGKCLI